MAKRQINESALSPLEEKVMDVIWKLGQARAEHIREALRRQHDFSDSTIRTLLRRIEAKGLLKHSVEGRTFVYRPTRTPSEMANRAVRGILVKFCKGSLPGLLIGMADDSMVSADDLRDLAAQIERKENEVAAKAKRSKRPG